MEKIKVKTGLAGDGFSYHRGETVERAVFAAQVGSGWEALCEETADEAPAPEIAIDERPAELVVEAPVAETATKHRRKK